VQLLDLRLLGDESHRRLLLVPISVVHELSRLQFERPNLFILHRDRDLSLITLLLLCLESQTVNG